MKPFRAAANPAIRIAASRRRSQAGSALLVTMIALFLVFGAMMLSLTTTANSLHQNRQFRAGASAFNIAESGAEAAVLWLKGQPSPPSGSAAISPFGGAQALDEGVFVAIVQPDPSNDVEYLKTYHVVSTGTVRGVSRTVEVVVKQASFGRYAYFTDSEVSSISGGAIWWKAGEIVDGPAHSNNAGGSIFQMNYNGSVGPIFLDVVTAAGSSINYSPTRPTDETAFRKIFKDGSKGYRLSVPTIPLPASTDTQRNAAWGSSMGLPSSSGVYLRADSSGGVYIRGDAALRFSVNSSGNQVLTVTQGSNTTNLVFNRSARSVTTSGPVGSGSVKTAYSLGNGVIYCTGNITSLDGEMADNLVYGDTIAVRSSWTIANDVNAGKTIKITNSLRYRTLPDKNLDSAAPVNLTAATLGLVSKDIIIASSAPKDLTIDAVCLAGGQSTTGGSFYVENYSSKTPVGTLRVLGGIIQKARGPVGTFNPSTGVMSTGYNKDYNYDPRLAINPPPFFPTTGQYERLSWQVLAP